MAKLSDVASAVLGPLLVFALACAVFWVDTRFIKLPPAWATFEFCQYAEIGKNLATEGTFDTRLVEPMALAYIDAHRAGSSAKRWPVVNRYPLPCVVIAGLMRVLGVGEMAAAWSNGLAAAALTALAYILARRWYGKGWAALVAALILANPSFSGYFVLIGTPDLWFALIFALELLAWSRLTDEPGARLGLAALTGALAGLAYLTRFNVVVFLAPQWGVLLIRRRWPDAAAMALASLATAAPMLVYNVRQFGTPMVGIYSSWNLLDGIGAYRVEPWLYYRVPNLGAELASHLRGFAAKFLTNLTRVVPTRVWSLWHLDLILPMAIVGLVLERKTGVRRFLAWSSGLFVAQLILFSALRLELEDRLSPHHGRYFFWFAVPAVLLGVGALKGLVARSRWWHVATLLVIAGQFALYERTWSGWIAQNRVGTNFGHDPIRRGLAKVVAPDQVIASNQPQMTAWFSELRSLSLPANPDELARVNRLSPTKVDYLFIDLNYNAIDLDRRWGPLVAPGRDGPGPWDSQVLADYVYAIRPEQTRPLMYVLLRRRSVPPGRSQTNLADGRRGERFWKAAR